MEGTQKNAMKTDPLGIYVHVPFCGTACDYCAFYQEEPRKENIEAWLAGIEKELTLMPFPRVADTFFIGGGTPGILSARHLERLADLLIAANSGYTPKEWSVEFAPATVKSDKLSVLRERGVNRISLGVQSFDTETLKLLGRRHSPKQIFSAYEKILSFGFDNLNFDLIFSVPGENPKRWQADLQQAITLNPEHLSAYCLILEDNAPLLTRLHAAGKLSLEEKSPEREAELYIETWEKLGAAGYAQYEVANHAKPGHECLHNLNTWKMQEWLGYGPAAASQCNNKRFNNPANLAKWLDALTDNTLAHENVETLSPEKLFEDAVIFGLRLSKGLDLTELSRRFKTPINPNLYTIAKDLRNNGYLKNDAPENRWIPTQRGLLVADAIALQVLSL